MMMKMNEELFVATASEGEMKNEKKKLEIN